MVILDHGPVLRRRERNKQLVRTRLREVALGLFRTHGYEATSVQQIADAADTAKATFFNYYPTKEHLLAEFHAVSVREILVSHARRTYTETTQSLLALTRAAMRWPEREPLLTAAIVRNLWGSPVLAEADRAIGEAFTDTLRNVLRAGMTRGEIRRDTDIGVTVALIMSVLNGCVLDWVMEKQKFNLGGTAARRMAALLPAFRPLKQSRGS